MIELREYQQSAIKSLWSAWNKNPKAAPLLVCPTGSGKSCIIASVVAQISAKNPTCRFLVVTHTKEIVRQNATELQKLIPEEPIGIYSAGLGSKQVKRITFANVQSIYKAAAKLQVSLVIIDEAHMLSREDSSMYQKLISGLQTNNPKVRILGLTATPMRMDQGSLIAEGSTFTEIAYEISIRKLIKDGYLSPLVSMSKKAVDLAGVKTSGYDYNQTDLQFAFNKRDVILAQVKEIISAGSERKHWLVFCAGIEHAQNVVEMFQAEGITADLVTGDQPTMIRDNTINRFMSGEVRALCNVGVLTTGFNFRAIDLVVLLRATKSASLYIQCVGRGTRTADGKRDCMVLDYGGNIDRHGPIDMIEISARKGEKRGEIGVAPHKKCPICGCVVAIKSKTCPTCDYAYPDPAAELEIAASSSAVISEPLEPLPRIRDIEIATRGVYRNRGKAGSFDSVRLSYIGKCHTPINDFLCLEHPGYPRKIAEQKWIQYGGQRPIPISVDEALIRQDELKKIAVITADFSQKFPKILKMVVAETVVEKYDPNDLNL